MSSESIVSGIKIFERIKNKRRYYKKKKNLRYADDTAVIAESEGSLQKLVNKINKESNKRGFKLNSNESETTGYIT